eukprot:TRINITY_DN11828_c0_g1_i1.p2 TRINITY_DN11828_c0_g1~~TRINITY_DN11828_c0_g1_i1.p2  ORF type:complete len:199 (+),score=26.71 TRINITY_DN11828_c0_g1_i1:791-1387(+)
MLAETDSKLLDSNSINKKYVNTIEDLENKVDILENDVVELEDTVKQKTNRIKELENIVKNLSSEKEELQKDIYNKNETIVYTEGWLEDIIPYYHSYTNKSLRYKGFTSHTATSENLNSLSKKSIKKLIESGTWFQALPFKRLYVRSLIEIIKSHNRDENIGLREILKEHRLSVERLLTIYYNTGSLSRIENYTKRNGW